MAIHYIVANEWVDAAQMTNDGKDNRDNPSNYIADIDTILSYQPLNEFRLLYFNWVDTIQCRLSESSKRVVLRYPPGIANWREIEKKGK